MTKTWDPNHASTLAKKAPKKSKKSLETDRRDDFVLLARRIARSCAPSKLFYIRDLLKRASKHAPISKRQIAGLTELLGHNVVERLGLEKI